MPTKPTTLFPIGILRTDQVIRGFLLSFFLAMAGIEYARLQADLLLEEQQLTLLTQTWNQRLQSLLLQPHIQASPTEFLADQILLAIPRHWNAKRVNIYREDGTYYQTGSANPVQNDRVTEDDGDPGAVPRSATDTLPWQYYVKHRATPVPTFWASTEKNQFLLATAIHRTTEQTALIIEVSVSLPNLLEESSIRHQNQARLVSAGILPSHWQVTYPWTIPWFTLCLAGSLSAFWLWFHHRRNQYFLPTRADKNNLRSMILHEFNIMTFQTNHQSRVLWVEGNSPTHMALLNVKIGDSILDKLRNYPQYMKHWQHSLKGKKLTYEMTSEDTCLRVYQWPVITKNNVLKGVNVVIQDISEQRQTEWQLQQKHLHDPITDLPNRQFFTEQLPHIIQAVDRRNEKLALLAIELTGLSHARNQTTEEISHSLLRRIVHDWLSCLSSEYTISRISHEEFLVVITNYRQLNDLKSLSEKLIEIANTPRRLNQHDLSLKANIGITTYPQDAADTGSLISNALIAKSHARKIGYNSVDYFSEESARLALEKWQLERNLAQAISQQDFALHYQPIFDLKSSKCIAAEALIRWPSANLGPDQFIPLAEESGLIHPIGLWVIESALHDFHLWKQQGLDITYISINLSVEQLKTDNFFEKLDEILKRYPLNEGDFLFELTESLMMQTNQTTIASLTLLRERGAHLAIDDFGTGYSSLNYLKSLPVNTLKIDRSFIPILPENLEGTEICEAIIQLAHTLRLNLIAEGVETQEQKEWLIDKGVHFAQGYFFAKPVKADIFRNYLSMK